MGTVTLRDVHKSYGAATIVERLNLDFPDGSFTVLVGPSGCGKSTTLRMIAGLESVTSGAVEINDKDVTNLEPRERNIAMVFQNYALYPHLTVLENIAFPLRATNTNRADARKRAQEIRIPRAWSPHAAQAQRFERWPTATRCYWPSHH